MHKNWGMRRKGILRSVSCVLGLLSLSSKCNLKDLNSFKIPI